MYKTYAMHKPSYANSIDIKKINI